MSILTINLFVLLGLTVALKAGIYIDNGIDQTTMERDLTSEEQIRLHLQILNVLGLPRKPLKVQKCLNHSTLRYLMDLYNFLNPATAYYRRIKRNIDRTSVEKLITIEDSDMIMAFPGTKKGRRIWFDISKMPIAENIVEGELRIFQKRIVTERENEVFTVAVYEARYPEFETDDIKMGDGFISSVTTTGGASGWLSFDVTSWILSWELASGATNGLYIVVYPKNQPTFEIRQEIIGITTDTEFEEMQPFLVIYFQNINNFYHPRFVRNITHDRLQKSIPETYSSVMRRSLHNTRKSACRIHTLYISFKDLKWQDWIIAPEGYSAFYCAGECRFPLVNNKNATRHALVQSWIHYMYPNKFPRPSCGPQETLPLYIIYRQADNAALQKRKDMIVRSCGCL